jgi:hypothetical protein
MEKCFLFDVTVIGITGREGVTKQGFNFMVQRNLQIVVTNP